MLQRWTTACGLVCVVVSGLIAADPAGLTAKAESLDSPAELAAPIGQLLDKSAVVVADKDGSPVLTVWFRSVVPAKATAEQVANGLTYREVPEGSLVGVVKFAGPWPELQPLRLVVHHAPRLDARQVGNVIHVGLPPGEQVAVAFSTTLDAEHLEKMALWRFHPVHDPNVPEADRRTLARAARDGWLWWLTPDEDLRLVHATTRPAIPPCPAAER